MNPYRSLFVSTEPGPTWGINAWKKFVIKYFGFAYNFRRKYVARYRQYHLAIRYHESGEPHRKALRQWYESGRDQNGKKRCPMPTRPHHPPQYDSQTENKYYPLVVKLFPVLDSRVPGTYMPDLLVAWKKEAEENAKAFRARNESLSSTR